MKTVLTSLLIIFSCLLPGTSGTAEKPVADTHQQEQRGGKGKPPLNPGRPGGGRVKSLYTRLGGKKVIIAVVDEFVNNLGADGRINRFFADTVKDPKRLAKFKGNLVNQICQASGGPCKYTGKDMNTAHKGMGISDADLNAFVEDLVKALDKLHVSATEKKELLGALGEMKADIVER